jgi:hypothetical protein
MMLIDANGKKFIVPKISLFKLVFHRHKYITLEERGPFGMTALNGQILVDVCPVCGKQKNKHMISWEERWG